MIVVGRLIDGTEIVGDMVGETENGIQIVNPVQVIYRHGVSSTTPAVSFARFMMFADQEEFDFQKVDFVAVSQVVPEMVKIYRRLIKQIKPEYEVTAKADDSSDPATTPVADSKKELYDAILQSLEIEEMTKH